MAAGSVLLLELGEPRRVAVDEHHARASGEHRLGAGQTNSRRGAR